MATAAIFVLVMLLGLYGGRYSFVLLFALITGLCLWEYLSLVLERFSRRDLMRKFLGLIIGMLPFILSSMVQLDLIRNRETFLALTTTLASPFIFLAFVYELYSGSQRPFSNLAFILLGMVYIGIPFALLDFIAFRGEDFDADTVFGILLLTWVNDTGAYLVGSQFGRHPLFPSVSPRKTWEGTIGGITISMLFGVLLYLFFSQHGLIDWLVLAALVAIFGTLGDLVESMLKRSMHVKDSGNILPGHGGLLDRFDAFIFCLPFVSAYLLWFR